MTNYKSSEGFDKTYTTKDAVIASGQSLSAAIDLEQLNIAGFQMPSAWTAAKLTFQVSADGVTYVDAVDALGNELQVTVSASKFVGVDMPELSGIRFLKVRSGTSDTPVSQAADRTINIILTSNAEASAAGAASQTAATIPTATTMQNAATANGNGASLNVQGYATAILNIASSPSMSGGTIVNFEASTDDSEWQPILAHQIGVQGSQVLTTSTDGDYRINCAGFKSIRARISGYSAGTVTVKGYTTPLSGPATTIGISGATDTAQTAATQTTSIGSFIKGLVKILADIWDSTLHGFRIIGTTTEVSGLSAGALNADLVPSTDVSAYKMFSLQVLGTFSGTLTIQGSNDNTNWISILCNDVAANTSASTITAAAMRIGLLGFKYLRVRMTSYSSGTATGILQLFTQPVTNGVMQSGTWSISSSPTAGSSGGSFSYINLDVDETGVNVTNSSTKIFGIIATNTHATDFRYLKIYNKASAPAVGTDTPIKTIPIPPKTTLPITFPVGTGAGTNGAFNLGFGVGATTGVANNDTGAPGANEVIVNIDYRN